MQIQASSDLLISQWRFAPKFSGFVQHGIDILQEDIGDTFTDLERMLNVDTATGVWLDFLGIRVGVRRPLLETPASSNRFGWRTTSPANSPQSPPYSFDQASFKGSLANLDRFPMSDLLYRRLVKARGILVTSRGAFEAFKRAINVIAPDAEVQDNRNMSVEISTNHENEIRIADAAGALPRTAGVKINFTGARYFGYKSNDGSTSSGEGFDRVRFG